MKEYEIVEYRNMKNILSPADISPENVYMYMYQLKADVLYIVEKDCLQGVISIGDLLRYYNKKISLKVNTNFHFINSFDDKKAYEILKEIPSIHELPVVTRGVFLGIIKFGEKDEDEWKKLKICIDYGRFGSKEEYLYGEFKKWLLRQKAKVVIYDELSWDIWEEMSSDSKKIFNERVEHAEEDAILSLYVLRNMREKQQRQFFGINYSENCVQEFMNDYSKIELVLENGIYSVKDMESKYFTFKNGYRVTPNNTGEMKKIYFYGACEIMGAYVSDSETIEYYLKKELIKGGYSYDVVNAGLWTEDRGELWINRMIRTNFREDDIIIILNPLCALKQLKEDYDLKNRYILCEYYGNNYKIKTDNILEHYLDTPYHHNSFINSLAAKNIFNDIRKLLKRRSDDYFVPWDSIEYYKKFFALNGIKPVDLTTGAILMTCNPFTKGHRYLIEKACEEVELLYVFIVEEEVNGFSFTDRFEMAKLGTSDLEKVKILPLGKYIASKKTFPQYFDRDNVVEIEETDYDIHIFADTIAKELGISYRFVGEEPFDQVTKAYNETMKRILPKCGITVKEIARKRDERGEVISASAVRKQIKDGNMNHLYSLLPETTIEYLKKVKVISG